MRFDIEVHLPNLGSDIETFISALDSGFAVDQVPRGGKKIRTDKSVTNDKLLPVAIREFLEDLTLLKGAIDTEAGILRIGIFFDIEEVAFLSISLPQSELKLIGEFSLAIEISAYPCVNDDEYAALDA